jgi:hypothetical protein
MAYGVRIVEQAHDENKYVNASTDLLSKNLV